ncbi:MAG: hypothetical protein WAL90_18010 [Desulfobacterales bacterium]
MSGDNSTETDEKKPIQNSQAKQLFGLYEIVFIILITLSIIGVGVTDFSPGDSHRYWFAMALVFAGACLLLEWDRARDKGQKWTTLLRTQFLIWIGLLLAVQIVYMMFHAGRLDKENTGLIILLLLSLTVFFAGINLSWRLIIVGIFLGGVLIGATFLEEFLWIFLLIGIVIVVIFLLFKHQSNTKAMREHS